MIERGDLIRMVREAGFTANDADEVFLRVFESEIERFAALIEQHVESRKVGSHVHDPRLLSDPQAHWNWFTAMMRATEHHGLPR